MPALIEYFLVFTLGGIGYGFIEVLYRGYTHWTMLIAGGICASILYFIGTKEKISMPKKCILGGAVITVVEFITGVIVNIGLGWNVWNYGDHFLNLLGQICPLFIVLWIVLNIPFMVLCRLINRAVSGSRR